MIDLLIKLLIAHVIADFVFQPNKWVEDKKEKTYQSIYFYLHGFVHLIALFILLEFNGSYWSSIVAIVVTHMIIDFFKLKFEKRFNPRPIFTFDQLLHLAVIGIVAFVNIPTNIDLEKLYSTELLLLILAILAITFVSSVVVKVIMCKWDLDEDKSEDSLESAGLYIGILERLFVFGFILLNQWSSIGLLIAAKSVFRFSDLSRAKDRKLTEYILIGTLISFGLAISVGILYLHISKLL